MRKTLMLHTDELESMAAALLASSEGNDHHLRRRKEDVCHAIKEYLSAAQFEGSMDTHLIEPRVLQPVCVSAVDYEQARWKADGRI